MIAWKTIGELLKVFSIIILVGTVCLLTYENGNLRIENKNLRDLITKKKRKYVSPIIDTSNLFIVKSAETRKK